MAQRHRPGWHRPLTAIGAGGVIVLALAACGGGPSPSSSTPSPSPSATPSSSPAPQSSLTTPMPTTGAAAIAAITSSWMAFFNAQTSTARREQLLEHGQAFASALRSQASSPLASSATAKVSSVTLTSPTSATVNYTVLVGGKPALTNQTGTAVYSGGVWKVSGASFCALLRMESGGASGLPAACHGG